jgi:hypothetical protein
MTLPEGSVGRASVTEEMRAPPILVTVPEPSVAETVYPSGTASSSRKSPTWGESMSGGQLRMIGWVDD